MQEVNSGFEIPTDDLQTKPIIKVIGVGGGGGNAVNYMYDKHIHGVDFVLCNTDKQALGMSPVPDEFKIQLGEKGLGAGNMPEIGRQAAESTMSPILDMLSSNTEMVFVTAGMGGGTGTGAAPVIAKAAKDLGILTIGIVTIPFKFEGNKRIKQAIAGLKEMRKSVDAIIIITNERIKQLYGDLKMSEGFNKANEVLTVAAKGIAEIITVTGGINVDLNDVRTVMTNSGDALMSSAEAAGANRATDAIANALESPLLVNSDISRAKDILLNISSSEEYEPTMDELDDITDFVRRRCNEDVNILWGTTREEELEDRIKVTIVITGIDVPDSDLEFQSNTSIQRQQTFIDRAKEYLGATPSSQPQQRVAVDTLEDEAAYNSAVDRLYGQAMQQPVRITPVAQPEPEPEVVIEPEPTPLPELDPTPEPIQEAEPVRRIQPMVMDLDDLDEDDLNEN